MREATDARQLSRAQQNDVTLQARLRAETKKEEGMKLVLLSIQRASTHDIDRVIETTSRAALQDPEIFNTKHLFSIMV